LLFHHSPLSSGLAATGTLQTDDGATTFSYSYDVLTDTSNVYNIQLFTNSSEFSFEGDPLTADFQKFVDFYGTFAYYDQQLLNLPGTSNPDANCQQDRKATWMISSKLPLQELRQVFQLERT
jgi:hypothetical protein